MDIQTAIEIVEYHQSWRLGEKEEMLYEPRVITEAINVLLAEVKSSINNNQTVSRRFYRGYTIYKFELWKAVNDETGKTYFHAKRLKDVVKMINEDYIIANRLN
jgi:hypothetical protein